LLARLRRPVEILILAPHGCARALTPLVRSAILPLGAREGRFFLEAGAVPSDVFQSHAAALPVLRPDVAHADERLRWPYEENRSPLLLRRDVLRWRQNGLWRL